MDEVFSPRNIQLAVIYLVALILSICVHEYGHAVVADRLGDRLPRAQGRVTLNPLAHVDPIGTVLFPLLGFFLSAGGSALGALVLGWGKPVQVSLGSRRMIGGALGRMKPKTAHLLVALAGPLMNVVFAAILSVLVVVMLRAGVGIGLFDPLSAVIQMNIGLALFNLIPCPPLDGGAVVAGLLPDGHPVVTFLWRYGQMIFLLLLFSRLLPVLMAPAHALASWWLQQLLQWVPV